MSDIHLCIVSERFFPAFSGAALRFKRYIPGLVSRGFRVEVLCGTPRNTVASHQTDNSAPVAGLQVHTVSLPQDSERRREREFAKAVAAHAGRMKGERKVMQLLTAGPGFSRTVRLVREAEVATVFSGTMVSEPHRNPIKQLRRRLILAAPLSRVDTVVASTGVMKKYFESLGVSAPIEVIPNGVDLRVFQPPSSAFERQLARQKLGISPLERVVLFVGSVAPRKGLDMLLRAWPIIRSEIPAARLHVVGPRNDQTDPAFAEYGDLVESLLGAPGVRESVRFVGVSNAVAEYMRAGDLLVFPSRREGMGNVVLEAMSSRVPVVLTPYVGLPEEFGSASVQYALTGFDPGEMAETVLRLLASEPAAAALAVAGRRWVEDNMNIEDIIDAYADLYDRVALPSRGMRVSHDSSQVETNGS